MSTIPNDQHKHHVCAFLRVLVSELSNRDALDATALVHRDDFGGCWEGRTVFAAVESVSRAAVDAGHPEQALDPMAVNGHLLEAGELTNEAFRSYWHELVAPAEPQAPGRHQLRELARRITESYFRTRHADIYGKDDSHLRPFEELTTEMNNYREELLAIWARIGAPATSSLSLVREGGAA